MAAIPDVALRTRLQREREAGQRALLAELGVTDPADVKKKLAALAEFEKSKTETERANMTELEQARADLAAERERSATFERERDEALQARQYEKHDQIVIGIAARFMAPKAVRLARVEFAEHIKTLTEKERELMTDRDAAKWFAAFAKENPEYAITAAAGAAGAASPKPVTPKPATRLLSNGQSARRATPPGGAPGRPATPAPERGELASGKTIRPGPKQASKAEIAAEWRKLGMNPPS